MLQRETGLFVHCCGRKPLNSQYKLDIKTGTLSPVAGNGGKGCLDGDGSVAQFYLPTGVAIESDSSLLVADYGNDIIRRITFTGGGRSIVETVAGKEGGFLDGDAQTAKFNSPICLCVDRATSTCFVADHDNNCIRKLSPK